MNRYYNTRELIEFTSNVVITSFELEGLDKAPHKEYKARFEALKPIAERFLDSAIPYLYREQTQWEYLPELAYDFWLCINNIDDGFYNDAWHETEADHLTQYAQPFIGNFKFNA